MCRNKCLPLLTITPVVLSGSIRAHMHLQRCIRRLSCIRQHASPVLHQVSTQPLEFLHVSTPRLYHVSRETLHRFSNVNNVLSDIRQLRHQVAVQSRLRWREFLGILDLCCSLFISPETWRIDACSTSQLFRVSFRCHLIIQHIDFDCSIEDLQLLRVTWRESNVPGLLHLKSFLNDFSKGLQLLLLCQHTRSRHRDTFLWDLRRDCKRKRCTRFWSSWNHPSTHLTMCLPKLTLRRLAFHTCSCKV